MPGDVRTNALDDLLDAERHFRLQAENALRDLRGVLTELAQRMAGDQIENARRTDPTAPENWGPERWRKFFAALPSQAAGVSWNDSLLTELAQLRTENQVLKGRLVAPVSTPAPAATPSNAETSVNPPRAVSLPTAPVDIMPPMPAAPPVLVDINSQGRMFAHMDLLRELRALRLPSSLPARLRATFPRQV